MGKGIRIEDNICLSPMHIRLTVNGTHHFSLVDKSTIDISIVTYFGASDSDWGGRGVQPRMHELPSLTDTDLSTKEPPINYP